VVSALKRSVTRGSNEVRRRIRLNAVSFFLSVSVVGPRDDVLGAHCSAIASTTTNEGRVASSESSPLSVGGLLSFSGAGDSSFERFVFFACDSAVESRRLCSATMFFAPSLR